MAILILFIIQAISSLVSQARVRAELIEIGADADDEVWPIAALMLTMFRLRCVLIVHS